MRIMLGYHPETIFALFQDELRRGKIRSFVGAGNDRLK
jgi:hypothetical protein